MIIGGGSRRAAEFAVKKEQQGVSSLTMYNDYPDTIIPFDDFAALALERFSVLQLFETVSSKYLKGSNEYLQKLDTELRKIGFLKTILYHTLENVDPNELSKDIISHCILRLAFCKTEELKKWFIQQEVDLFRYKLSKINSGDTSVIETFLRDNGLYYTPISEQEKTSISSYLAEVGQSAHQIMHQNYFKVDFNEVIDLVKQRKVYLKGGFAYVTLADFNSILTHIFRAKLSLNLTILSRQIRYIEEDQRVSELLTILRERNVGNTYGETESRDHLTSESLDGHAVKSFPLCMRYLHETLKQNHHLKHYGRLQYLLFLKGIGLPLEENLKFWRTEFSKGTMTVDRFDKEYAYNIRHSYGREGKRISYTPYSCLKIITSHLPAAGDHHGCPFRHFDREFLKQKLKTYGRNEDETQQIMELVDSNGYQLACQRYFEFTHKTDEIITVNHPNQYFEQSYRIHNGQPINQKNNNNKSYSHNNTTQAAAAATNESQMSS